MKTSLLKKSLLLSLALIGFIQPALQAQPEQVETIIPTFSEHEISLDRFGASVIPGVNVISPFLGVQLSYRLPVLEDRLRLVAQYDFYTIGLTLPDKNTQHALFGVRYDLSDPIQTSFRNYAQLLVGSMMYIPRTAESSFESILAAELSIGTETQLIGPLWGFVQVGAFFPLLVRSQLGLRLAF